MGASNNFNIAFDGSRYAEIPAKLKPLFEAERSRAKRWIKVARKMKGVTRQQNITFDYVNNGSVNAEAKIVDGKAYIGMNRGTILTLFDLFNRILSHPKSLPHIGRPETESENEQHKEGMFSTFDERRGFRNSKGRREDTITPRDPLRRAFSQMAVMFALDFLITHEVTHISHGHMDYLGRAFGMYGLREVQDDRELNAERNFVTQVLEMDADANAVSASLTAAIHMSTDVVKLSKLAKMVLADAKSAAFLWSFAVAALFYMWDLQYSDLDTIYTEDHPPSTIRLTMVVADAVKLIGKDFHSRKATVMPVFLDAHRHLDDAVRLTNDAMTPEDRPYVAETLSSTAAEEYRTRLRNRWKVIRDDVKAHGFFR